MIVKTTCPRCRKMTLVEVNANQYMAWKDGELIQKAMPSLSTSEREMLMTGYCSTCWDIVTNPGADGQ
jgi:hypothetical protein